MCFYADIAPTGLGKGWCPFFYIDTAPTGLKRREVLNFKSVPLGAIHVKSDVLNDAVLESEIELLCARYPTHGLRHITRLLANEGYTVLNTSLTLKILEQALRQSVGESHHRDLGGESLSSAYLSTLSHHGIEISLKRQTPKHCFFRRQFCNVTADAGGLFQRAIYLNPNGTHQKPAMSFIFVRGLTTGSEKHGASRRFSKVFLSIVP